MTGSRRFLTMTVVIGSLALLAAGVATTSARAGSRSCGIISASGHQWIIVAKNVPCTTAKSVARRLAARTAAVRRGQSVVVASPLRGFHCVLASQGKPGGSCATPGAAKSILWISA